MSLLNLLSLEDEDIDRVTGVVREWCQRHHVPPDSQRGRQAMHAAVRLSLAGQKSTHMLTEMLSREMRLEQFKHPSD